MMLFRVAIVSFVLNLIWENLHSYLYAGYMGGRITQLILLEASLIDALLIILISLPFIYREKWRGKSWLIIPFGIIISIIIELGALYLGRWSYNEYMPLIPLLRVGLTPTIQLGLLGYISYKFLHI
jgi:hypothetical protein